MGVLSSQNTAKTIHFLSLRPHLHRYKIPMFVHPTVHPTVHPKAKTGYFGCFSPKWPASQNIPNHNPKHGTHTNKKPFKIAVFKPF